MHVMSLVEEELGGPTVFKDLAKLDFDYVPDNLPGREEAIKFLASTYRGLTQGASREQANCEADADGGAPFPHVRRPVRCRHRAPSDCRRRAG